MTNPEKILELGDELIVELCEMISDFHTTDGLTPPDCESEDFTEWLRLYNTLKQSAAVIARCNLLVPKFVALQSKVEELKAQHGKHPGSK